LYHLASWINLSLRYELYGDCMHFVFVPITPLLEVIGEGLPPANCYFAHPLKGGALLCAQAEVFGSMEGFYQNALHWKVRPWLHSPIYYFDDPCILLTLPYGRRGIPGSASHWWRALVGVSFTCTVVFLSASPQLYCRWLHRSDLPLLGFIGKESFFPCRVFFLLDIQYTYMLALTLCACAGYRLRLLAMKEGSGPDLYL